MTHTGQLYIVATPIGHLEDITFRAVSVLKRVDLIAAEDTRETGKLLRHYDIQTPLVSCHEHNEADRAADLIQRIATGHSVALVSDAGTPVVSDPGYALVRRAVESGIPVVPIPGPSAAIAGLMAAGLPTDAFLFLGFLPKKGGKREERLAAAASLPWTLIFYESPRRVGRLIQDLRRHLGERRAVVCREMTKMHEEFVRGRLSEIAGMLERRPALKGECTVLVAGAEPGASVSMEQIRTEIRAALAQGGQSVSGIARQLSETYRIPKNKVYKEALQIAEREMT